MENKKPDQKAKEHAPQKIAFGIYLYANNSYSYLINDKKVVLIDAGILVDKKIDLLIITHCHCDHILYAHELKDKYNCRIAAGSKDVNSIESLDEATLKEMSPKRLIPIEIDMKLKEGDVIKTGKHNFRVLETPGHTRGSISLYEPNQKILFSGDAWFGGNNMGRATYPGGNKEELLKSVGRLKKLDVKLLCPGHWGIKRISE